MSETGQALLKQAAHLTREAWHEARRWERPMSVSGYVAEMAGLLGAACDCAQCSDSGRREEYYRRNPW
mgnify:CR=1 FL=1